ncbi:helix-turn-helix domain-containing protein [Paraburkholderia sprentiae WSM5005]|uniref:Helix-turn-helix domain-containing protein n=1 Tax=Paraburkholderia sprentiae WSM5005 TaxID=754502 RepID=A0A1I9YJM5_9BURK|nr:helix-turn-helix transcriptional regulator [Paraburkholderia sprentiae]APA86508.2 helix-turn-helix domain-containing protein [Paraburkholderia sprentiae WSM5005]
MSSTAQLAKTIGEIIAARRKALGMTQVQLADLLQIEQPVLSRIERGSMPSLERLAAIAEVLECRVVDLLGVSATGSIDRAMRIHDRLAKLSPDQQEAFEKMMDNAFTLVEAPQEKKKKT